MVNYRGSEWNRWDLHVHTVSSYDYKYKGDDADDLLCAALTSNGIKAAAIRACVRKPRALYSSPGLSCGLTKGQTICM